ncbi:MAG: helix-turn-helix transcriptional regulator [Hyphomonadaceae bacterium]
MPRAALPWTPRGLNREQAAAYVGVSATTFDALVQDGRMPAPICVGRRRIFDREAIDLAFAALGESVEELNDFDG